MVDILGIINELPTNPSEALIELNWRISKIVDLFEKHNNTDKHNNYINLLKNIK